MRNSNWAEYNRQLVQRGGLTFLVDPKILHTKKCKSRRRPTEFSDALIVMLFTIKIQYRLSYRALEGFASWIFGYMYSDLIVPSYSLNRVGEGLTTFVLPHHRTSVVAYGGFN